MNLYLISQNENLGYDTYDSAVVAAESEDDARMIHPDRNDSYNYGCTWCHPDYVDVELIGIAKEGTQPGVICASYTAG